MLEVDKSILMKARKSLKQKEKDKVIKAQQVEIPQDFAVMEMYAKETF